jgi:hypothetical protein
VGVLVDMQMVVDHNLFHNMLLVVLVEVIMAQLLLEREIVHQHRHHKEIRVDMDLVEHQLVVEVVLTQQVQVLVDQAALVFKSLLLDLQHLMELGH